MILDEAITQFASMARTDEMCAAISVTEQSKEVNRQIAEKHRQLAEWLKELKRADTLLKATYDFLNKQHGNYYGLKLLAEPVYYDGAEGDGNCLMEDIDAWMDERGIDHDNTRN